MKYFFITFILLSILTPAIAELDENDLNKIRLIVNESKTRIKEEIKSELKPIKADIAKLKEDVARLDGRITGLDGRIAGLEKQNILIALVVGLIAIIVAAIGIPQIIIARRSKTESNEQDKINQELRAEIETLKKQRIQAE